MAPFPADPGEDTRVGARLDSLRASLLDLSLRNRLLNFRQTRLSLMVAASRASVSTLSRETDSSMPTPSGSGPSATNRR
jgi:hypothetical protein